MAYGQLCSSNCRLTISQNILGLFYLNYFPLSLCFNESINVVKISSLYYFNTSILIWVGMNSLKEFKNKKCKLQSFNKSFLYLQVLLTNKLSLDLQKKLTQRSWSSPLISVFPNPNLPSNATSSTQSEIDLPFTEVYNMEDGLLLS